jgi:hypothetical protein
MVYLMLLARHSDSEQLGTEQRGEVPSCVQAGVGCAVLRQQREGTTAAPSHLLVLDCSPDEWAMAHAGEIGYRAQGSSVGWIR